jgi:heme exporter protein C
MRQKTIYTLAVVAAILLVRNLHTVLLELPDDADQGMIYRILFFHVPSWFVAGFACMTSLIASVLYLITKNFKYDSLAVSATETGIAFMSVGMVTGSIWGRMAWGIWWTWDARLTSALALCLLYFGYLVLRTAIEEPTQRAKIAAVFSIFAFADVPIVWYSIEWFRTQHPAPVLRAGGFIDPAMKAALYWNVVPLAMIGTIFLLLRYRQEGMRREIDSLRRLAHATA